MGTERRYGLNGQFEDIPHTPAVLNPEQISRHQFRQAILFFNKAAEFTTFYNAQSAADKLRLDNIRNLGRNTAIISSFQSALGYSNAQIDAFFRKAVEFEE